MAMTRVPMEEGWPIVRCLEGQFQTDICVSFSNSLCVSVLPPAKKGPEPPPEN